MDKLIENDSRQYVCDNCVHECKQKATGCSSWKKNISEIQMGTKVRYKTEDGNELNLIAIQHEKSKLFDTWICVNPNCESKIGKCTLYNCFTDELELGWK